MTWKPYHRGDGEQREAALADPPPWRTFPRRPQHREYRPPPGLVDAVNAALHLRRPLLVSGPAGSGKTSVIEQVAHELRLGGVLRWHITSRSSLTEALYRYDALGRIHAQSLRSAMSQGAAARTGRGRSRDEIGPFLQLGPLGTALVPSEQPRALLIDEIDKSDLDLPSDLLEVLERGEFVIPELVRYRKPRVAVRLWDSDEEYVVERGRVPCTQFPFILLTSTGAGAQSDGSRVRLVAGSLHRTRRRVRPERPARPSRAPSGNGRGCGTAGDPLARCPRHRLLGPARSAPAAGTRRPRDGVAGGRDSGGRGLGAYAAAR
ncbi:AAA family ATPase [Streptomyces bacillaris]|uniref:AAA family ATPase n=1 Tax=Streptomyces bacillaris TaxID=68179 RepID=UPI003460C7CB